MGKRRVQAVVFKTTWGWMGVAAGTGGLRAIVLPRASRQAVEARLWQEIGNDAACKGSIGKKGGGSNAARKLLRLARTQLKEFLGGRRRILRVPVDLSGGTPFQRRVWRAIWRIPYGKTCSYRWVAAHVGGPRYARAVGNALGANPVPLVIPCHRIVASARRTGESHGRPGSLGGFTGGLRLKRRLLALEGTLPLLTSGKMKDLPIAHRPVPIATRRDP